MTEQRIPLKSLSPEQREQRLALQRADAERAMKEHEEARRALYANRDRLRALRLAKEAQELAK